MIEDLNPKNLFQLEDELYATERKSYTAGIKWADAKATFSHLERVRHKVRAMAMPNEGSQAAKEAEAEKSALYNTHLEGMYAAQKEFLKAEVEYETLKTRIDSLRTIISNRKAMLLRGIEDVK
jgi:SMC interacting uncharacterized protein involved in chromosome segregation